MLNNETLSTIRNRRSTREFDTRPLSAQELAAVIEAGDCAPYANKDARHFAVVDDSTLLARLSEDSKQRAKKLPWLETLASNPGWHIFYDAPAVVFISGPPDAIAIESDCAAAAENVLIAAESIGLGACWIGIVGILFGQSNSREYLDAIGVPDSYRPFACIAMGHKRGSEESTGRRLLASHCIFPVPDLARTADYYANTLGFRVVPWLQASEPHICLYRDATEIVLTSSGGKPAAPNRQLYGYGYDAYFITTRQAELQEEFEKAGAKIVRGLGKTDYQNRDFVLEDIDGRWLAFGIKEKNG